MGRGYLLPADKKVTKMSVFRQIGRILQEAEEAIMREILAKDITAAVKKLCIDAPLQLSPMQQLTLFIRDLLCYPHVILIFLFTKM